MVRKLPLDSDNCKARPARRPQALVLWSPTRPEVLASEMALIVRCMACGWVFAKSSRGNWHGLHEQSMTMGRA